MKKIKTKMQECIEQNQCTLIHEEYERRIVNYKKLPGNTGKHKLRKGVNQCQTT